MQQQQKTQTQIEDNTASDIWHFVNTIIKGANKYGHKNLKQLLYAFYGEDNKFSKKEKELLGHILQQVTSSFQISYNELVAKNSTDTTDARRIYVTLVKKHLNISDSKIAPMIKRDDRGVTFLRKEFNEYDEKIVRDKQILDIFAQIDKQVATYKQTLEIKYTNSL